MVPAISAPQAIKINGADFFTAQTGIGASPTLSCSAPAVGTAAVYTVHARRFYKDAQGRLQRTPRIFTLQTTNTSITLPNLLG